MKANRTRIAIAVLLILIAAIYYYILLPWTNVDAAGIKKELPAATGQLDFHHGSEFITGLYQIPEVISNDR